MFSLRDPSEEVCGNFSLKRHVGLSAIRLESGRMQKRRERQLWFPKSWFHLENVEVFAGLGNVRFGYAASATPVCLPRISSTPR